MARFVRETAQPVRISNRSMACCLYSLACLFHLNNCTRAEERVFQPGDRAIVAVPSAELMVEAKAVGKIARGEVVQVVRVDQEWLFAWEHQGWLHQDDVWTPVEAEKHFDQEIKTKPTATAWHDRGVARAAARRYADAIADFNTALETDPKNVSALNNRGAAWHKQKELDRAIKDFSAAIELSPRMAVLWLNRSAAWGDKGNVAKSLEDAKKAVELSPQSPAALNARGVGWLQSGELEKAFADFALAIEKAPHFAAAHANRASVLNRQKKYELARKDYETAIELDGQSAPHKNDLAWMLATCPEKSFRDGRRALRLALESCRMTNQSDWNMLDTLATAYSETGDDKQAAATWEKAIRHAPESQRDALRAKLEEAANRSSKK